MKTLDLVVSLICASHCGPFAPYLYFQKPFEVCISPNRLVFYAPNHFVVYFIKVNAFILTCLIHFIRGGETDYLSAQIVVTESDQNRCVPFDGVLKLR